jgi:hypothetical protein
VTEQIYENFGDIPVFPVIGNNDVMYHYEPPVEKYHAKYYDTLFGYWFENITANNAFMDDIMDTFKYGGYYYTNITEDTYVIGLNSVYFSHKCPILSDYATAQLEWYNETLQAIAKEDKQAFVIYHIFPGMNYHAKSEYMWHDNYTESYLNITYQYQDNILMQLGSHIHKGNVKASKMHNETYLEVPLILTPAVTPIYNNNPTFSYFELDGKHLVDFHWVSWQFQNYVLMKGLEFYKTSLKGSFGVDLNDFDSVKQFYENTKRNVWRYAKFNGQTNGYDSWVTAIESMLFALDVIFSDGAQTAINYQCSYEYYYEDDYETCIAQN